jgi:hypothetical protein
MPGAHMPEDAKHYPLEYGAPGSREDGVDYLVALGGIIILICAFL